MTGAQDEIAEQIARDAEKMIVMATGPQAERLNGMLGDSVAGILLVTAAADEIELLRSQLETERGHREADNAESKAEIERLRSIVDDMRQTNYEAGENDCP